MSPLSKAYTEYIFGDQPLPSQNISLKMLIFNEPVSKSQCIINEVFKTFTAALDSPAMHCANNDNYEHLTLIKLIINSHNLLEQSADILTKPSYYS